MGIRGDGLKRRNFEVFCGDGFTGVYKRQNIKFEYVFDRKTITPQSSCHLKIISLEYLFLLFHQTNTSIKLLAILLPQNSLVNINHHFGLSPTLHTN